MNYYFNLLNEVKLLLKNSWLIKIDRLHFRTLHGKPINTMNASANKSGANRGAMFKRRPCRLILKTLYGLYIILSEFEEELIECQKKERATFTKSLSVLSQCFVRKTQFQKIVNSALERTLVSCEVKTFRFITDWTCFGSKSTGVHFETGLRIST